MAAEWILLVAGIKPHEMIFGTASTSSAVVFLYAVAYTSSWPSGVTSELGRTFFGELMNDVLRPPYVQRFVVDKYLKMR
jgi:hypothetical protein